MESSMCAIFAGSENVFGKLLSIFFLEAEINQNVLHDKELKITR